MTVSSQPLRADYNGNSATTAFSVPWYFQANSHVKAIYTDANGTDTTWVEGTHYTLSGAGNSSGGTLTVKTTPTDYTPATGTSLHILPNVPLTQATDFVENESLPAATQEAIPDKLTQICRMLQETVNRCYKLAESSTDTPDVDDLAALADSIQATVDQFEESYLGAHASDPTLTNTGEALAAGMLYYKTSAPTGMRVYNGSAWEVAYNPSSASGVDSFNARTGAVLPASGDYSIGDITGASTVADTGDYDDLLNKPALGAAATSNSYNDLDDLPALGAVATSNSYNDLDDLPTLGTAAELDVGTTANKVVQLDASAKLPAVDGSALTNLPTTGASAPTSEVFPVNSWALCKVLSGTIANTSTTSGSNLKTIYFDVSGVLTEGATQTGTWKNVSGASIGSPAVGLFVRTA